MLLGFGGVLLRNGFLCTITMLRTVHRCEELEKDVSWRRKYCMRFHQLLMPTLNDSEAYFAVDELQRLAREWMQATLGAKVNGGSIRSLRSIRS